VTDLINVATPIIEDNRTITNEFRDWLYRVRDAAAKAYSSFYTTTGGVTAIAATPLQLVIGSTRINSGEFSLASNEITVNKTGNFDITLDCYLNSSGVAQSEYSVYLEIDTGSGWSEVTASRAATYQGGNDSGMSLSINLVMAVASGSKFRGSVVRTDGSGTVGYQDDNGTRFSLVEV
jgi:hypothetical protein